MNEKTINEQYAYIRTLLEDKRLKEALMQLESFVVAVSRLGFTYPPGAIADLIQVHARLYETRRKRPGTVESVSENGGGHMGYRRPIATAHVG